MLLHFLHDTPGPNERLANGLPPPSDAARATLVQEMLDNPSPSLVPKPRSTKL
jgi:hypothetical protein